MTTQDGERPQRASRLWVDFNEVGNADVHGRDDELWTSVKRLPSWEWPQVGDVVETFDGDGDFCFGTVTTVSGCIVVVRLDWSTWRTRRFDTGGDGSPQ